MAVVSPQTSSFSIFSYASKNPFWRRRRKSSIRAKMAAEFEKPEPVQGHSFRRHRVDSGVNIDQKVLTQSVLLLHAPRERYALDEQYKIPSRKADEVLVRNVVIGLNPLDWKSADYNFGIPHLPYISGRDFCGVVVECPENHDRIKAGDVVLCASTDYRDPRKAAYQQYSIATPSTVCRTPENVSPAEAASVGVAFIASALAMGVCYGADFSKLPRQTAGPDVLRLIRSLSEDKLPQDVRQECLYGIEDTERFVAGEWLAIWGGSSTTGLFTTQIAKLLGAKVILVVDVGKHGARLSQSNADLLVDCHDHQRAAAIIRSVTSGKLRFAMDTTGKETATHLQEAFGHTSSDDSFKRHLVGLTGLPKERKPHVNYHNVPIKIHHEVAEVGDALNAWLEILLAQKQIVPPAIETAPGGLAGINDALDRMRRGEISGKRLVVPLEDS